MDKTNLWLTKFNGSKGNKGIMLAKWQWQSYNLDVLLMVSIGRYGNYGDR